MKMPVWLRVSCCICLCAAAGCVPTPPGLVAVQPESGFGRVACYGYAGSGPPYSTTPSLEGPAPPSRPNSNEISRSAWVVVDSASTTMGSTHSSRVEWLATFLWRSHSNPSKNAKGGDSVLVHADTVHGFRERWKWTKQGSVVVTHHEAFSADVDEWHFSQVGEDLQGTISHVSPRLTSRDDYLHQVSTRPLRLVRIDCASVPTIAVIR